MAGDGASARVIAEALGEGFTRNAVIGMLRRMNVKLKIAPGRRAETIMTKPEWTAERVETIKSLWGTGLSAAQIASRLGASLSRSAVLGKVHRLGLPRATEPRRTLGRPAVTSKPATPKAETPPAGLFLGVKMENLTRTHCRYPEGDPVIDITFCGQPRDGASSYCAHHRKIVWRAGNPSKRTR
jgi:GcrA cell cycle regulator